MDPFQLMREVDAKPDPTSPARIARSRARVLNGLSAAPKRRRRARWVWGGTAALGGLSTAAIAATVIIVGVASPVVVQPASAAAVEVLAETADLIITGVDPVVGQGQYLKIRETSKRVALWDADAGFNTATLPNSQGAVYEQGVRELYVPSDRTQDWIIDDRARNEALEVWGDPRTRAAYAELSKMSALSPGTDADPAGIVAARNGVRGGAYYDRFRPFYDAMPRDPHQLLAWYRQNLNTTDDWDVFQNIGQGLRANLMPDDLRAASLRVLGLLNNVEVTATNGQITTLAMQSSLGWGGQFGNLLLSELDIDTSTGQITGIRESYPNRSTNLVPAGTPWASWQIEITVVNEAPAP